MNKNMNISTNINELTFVVAGKNSIAVNIVAYLLDKINILPNNINFIPNKNDYGEDGWQPSFKKYCISRNVAQTDLEMIYEKRELIFISSEFDKIINPKLFVSNNLINIHFSLLPSYKGMYTATLPLIFGEKCGGVTIHKIDDGIDTGPIISQKKYEIPLTYTARDLYFKNLEVAFELFKSTFPLLLCRDIPSSAQPCEGSSYFGKNSIDYNNISINLRQSSFQIYNYIRAFIFKEYQLPSILNYKISSCELTDAKTDEKCMCYDNGDHIVLSGIDRFIVIAHKIK